MLVHYAVQWHITLTEQSGVAMTLLALSMAVPMFLVSPFAGVWADRYSKKLLINIADAGIAVVTLIMAVIFSIGFQHMALLLVCTAARGLGQGVQTPAVGSFLPEMVPAEHLTRINGINSSIQSAAMLVSPMAAGALIALVPLQYILYIDVVSAAIGISLLLFFVKVPKRERVFEQKPAWREMSEGLKYIWGHPFLKKLMILNVMFNLTITPAAVLTPLQTVRDFGEEPWRLVALELSFFIGMAAGGALIGAWGGFKNKAHTIAFANVFFGLSAIGLGLMENFALYLGCMGLAGLVVPSFNAPLMTMMQTKVDSEYMGRVFAVFTMLSSITMPVGMTVWGPLADKVRIDWLMIVSGIMILAISVFIISSKTLMDAGRPEGP
jgi:DHA3 family macrolide efflux protein-like MFS transporter